MAGQASFRARRPELAALSAQAASVLVANSHVRQRRVAVKEARFQRRKLIILKIPVAKEAK